MIDSVRTDFIWYTDDLSSWRIFGNLLLSNNQDCLNRIIKIHYDQPFQLLSLIRRCEDVMKMVLFIAWHLRPKIIGFLIKNKSKNPIVEQRTILVCKILTCYNFLMNISFWKKTSIIASKGDFFSKVNFFNWTFCFVCLKWARIAWNFESQV